MAGRAEQALERMIALTEGRPYIPLRSAGPSPRRLVARLAAGLVALLLAFAVVVALGTAVDNGLYRVVAMEGVSMEPSIRAGDALLVTSPPRRLRAGMIVMLEVDRRLVVHRVVAAGAGGRVTTKGDANPRPDTWMVGRGDVVVKGLYRGRLPHLGRLLRLVQRAAT